MKRVWLVALLGVLLFSFLAAGCSPEEPGADGESLTIGIVQFAIHDALNDARKGFIEALEEEGFVDGDNVSIITQNAQGEVATATTIAEGFVADRVDLILAIATPAAQAACNVTSEIPIMITAVTDPVDAGLAESLEKPGGNVTGTHDMNPIKEQLELLREIFPDAASVGVIFDAGEDNSRIQVEILEEEAKKAGLAVEKATASNTGEVGEAAGSLVDKVDAFYIPTDNTVVDAIGSVIKISKEHSIPVISGEGSCVSKGALATIGIDYRKLGYQTGKMAAKILRGEAEPATMAIEGQSEYSIIVNKAAAEKLSVTLPRTLLEQDYEIIE